MNGMHGAVEDYLTMRRALGFKLADHGWLLHGVGVAVGDRLAGTQTWCAARLSVVRGFARYLHTVDPATEVPPAGLLTYRRRRALCARAESRPAAAAR